jgi:hypothetical protein
MDPTRSELSRSSDALAIEEREWLTDRERRNPAFRFVIHFVAPILTSVTFHILLLALLALKTWDIVSTRAATDEFEAQVALTRDLSGNFKWPGETEIALVAPDEPPQPEIQPPKISESPSMGELLKGARTDANSEDTGGFGVGDIGRSGVIGIGSGAGTGGGGGIGSGFGGGTGIGKANVWNLNASGNHFAYVVDFSGSITVVQDDLKRELKRSVGALRAPQTFDVITFFSDTSSDKERFVTESFEPALVPAEPANKRRFFSWIDRRTPRGQTEPLQALKRALAMKPDAVFFFSDGFFDEKVLADVVKANEDQKIVVHCLVFDELLLSDRSSTPKLTDGARRMQRLAEKCRGKVKVVTGNDLGKR